VTPQPNQLWNLGGVLFELLEAREEAAQRVAIAEQFRAGTVQDETLQQEAGAELAAIEHGITQFVAQQLRDVDGLRAPLKALEQGVAINKADAAAATNRAMVLQNRYDKLKDLIRSCMIALDQAGEWKPKESRKFESARGSFTLRGNGGAQPVEITDPILVPDEYKRITVTMPLNLWMERGCSAFAGCEVKTSACEVSKSAVAEALAKPCGLCEGSGQMKVTTHRSVAITQKIEMQCEACGGTGQTGVPGARLGERGQSVVIK
jgi:hypothetical protein